MLSAQVLGHSHPVPADNSTCRSPSTVCEHLDRKAPGGRLNTVLCEPAGQQYLAAHLKTPEERSCLGTRFRASKIPLGIPTSRSEPSYPKTRGFLETYFPSAPSSREVSLLGCIPDKGSLFSVSLEAPFPPIYDTLEPCQPSVDNTLASI